MLNARFGCIAAALSQQEPTQLTPRSCSTMVNNNATSGVLEPTVAKAIVEAFEGACDALRAQGQTMTHELLSRLAGTIIDLAEKGTHCPKELKEAALTRLQPHRTPPAST